jgi:hypothetical protein
VLLIRAAVHPRDDGSTGVREWTGILVDNAAVRYLAQPFPAVVLLAGVWWLFTLTQALRWSTSDGIGRTIVDAVFLLVGLVAVPALVTPIAAGARRPTRAAALVRIGGAVVVGASLVALGIAFRGPLGLIDASWFGAMGRTWGVPPLVDQARGGLVLIVAGIAFVVVVVAACIGALRRTTPAPASSGPIRRSAPDPRSTTDPASTTEPASATEPASLTEPASAAEPAFATEPTSATEPASATDAAGTAQPRSSSPEAATTLDARRRADAAPTEGAR